MIGGIGMVKNLFVILALISIVLLAGCIKKETNNISGTSLATGEVKEFDVIAKQWEFVPNVIEVNKGDRVRLKVTSIDVTHGIGLPDFGIDSVRLPPNETKTVEFIADKTGTFNTMICTVYCGPGHAGMKGSIVVK